MLLDKHARLLKEQLKGLWASSNRIGQRADAEPMRYRHQQQLLDMVDAHLGRLEKVGRGPGLGRGVGRQGAWQGMRLRKGRRHNQCSV